MRPIEGFAIQINVFLSCSLATAIIEKLRPEGVARGGNTFFRILLRFRVTYYVIIDQLIQYKKLVRWQEETSKFIV